MSALTIHNLVKTYANGVQALKGVDLTVEEGDFFALLGPNGAGKSTLIGVLTSLVNKTAGSVKVFGYDIDTHFPQARECIGVVPQEFNFSTFEKPWDIVVNQAGFYGVERKTAERNAERLLKQLQLWDKRNVRSRTLSGGMKRRLMIARALVHEPKLLILDEPTAGVDIEIRMSMWAFLEELNAQGTTVILTTHYLEEAEELCRNIAIINHGDIVVNTPKRELLKQLNEETLLLNLCHDLESLPEIPNIRLLPTKEDGVVEVKFPTDMSISKLVDLLHEHNIRVDRLDKKQNRLEELFVRLTMQEEQA